jgi:hypothetical protein
VCELTLFGQKQRGCADKTLENQGALVLTPCALLRPFGTRSLAPRYFALRQSRPHAQILSKPVVEAQLKIVHQHAQTRGRR